MVLKACLVYVLIIVVCSLTAGFLACTVFHNDKGMSGDMSNHFPEGFGQPYFEPGITPKQLRGHTLNISGYCLTKAKLFLNHQRGGWGRMTPEDLYQGAYETYNTSLGPFLPLQIPEKVLDIGCGMALYDTFVFKKYGENANLSMYLLDKSTDEVHSPGFKNGGFNKAAKFRFYTSLECARQTLIDNGAPVQHVHTLNASAVALENLESGSFDFVFSLLSWGHHYPITTYIDSVKRIMKVHAQLLVDLRYKSKDLKMASSANNQITMAEVVRVCKGGAELRNRGFQCQAVRIRPKGLSVLCGRKHLPF